MLIHNTAILRLVCYVGNRLAPALVIFETGIAESVVELRRAMDFRVAFDILQLAARVIRLIISKTCFIMVSRYSFILSALIGIFVSYLYVYFKYFVFLGLKKRHNQLECIAFLDDRRNIRVKTSTI